MHGAPVAPQDVFWGIGNSVVGEDRVPCAWGGVCLLVQEAEIKPTVEDDFRTW